IISYGAMMKAYLDHDCGNKAFELYQDIKANNLELNEVTCILGLNACGSVVNIDEGKQIHEYINTIPKLKCNIKIQNTLVDMYSKCGNLNQSIQIFNNITQPDIITYGAMLKAYLDHDCGNKAFELYQIIKA